MNARCKVVDGNADVICMRRTGWQHGRRPSNVTTTVGPGIGTDSPVPATATRLAPRPRAGRPVAVSFPGPRSVALVEEEVAPLRPGTVRVRTLYSGISAGTEMT